MATVTTNTFGYNAKSELIAAALGLDDYDYDYDQIGNRLSAISDVALVVSTNLYKSNELNQYTNIVASGVPAQSPTYDPDGNMTNYNGWTYTWNGENRLITAEYGQSLVVALSYDYMGRRFSKVVDDGSTVTTNTFVYDGWLLVSEQSAGGGNLSTNHYVWGLDLSGSMQGAGGIGGLLTTVQDGEAYFSCFDANGNITEYTDTNGTIVASYQYDPYGNPTQASGSESSNLHFRFSTKYLDSETSLYYYGYRYYNPELGRWPSRDPIGERGGINLQGFVINNPMVMFDTLGLDARVRQNARCNKEGAYGLGRVGRTLFRRTCYRNFKKGSVWQEGGIGVINIILVILTGEPNSTIPGLDSFFDVKYYLLGQKLHYDRVKYRYHVADEYTCCCTRSGLRWKRSGRRWRLPVEISSTRKSSSDTVVGSAVFIYGYDLLSTIELQVQLLDEAMDHIQSKLKTCPNFYEPKMVVYSQRKPCR